MTDFKVVIPGAMRTAAAQTRDPGNMQHFLILDSRSPGSRPGSLGQNDGITTLTEPRMMLRGGRHA